MTQLNLPRKRVALAQTLISLLLILLTLIFSFTAVLSIDISDSELRESVQATVDSLSEEVDGLDSIEIPEKIDVTMPKLVKADMIFFKLITVAANSAKSNDTVSQQERDKMEKAAAELEEMVMSEEGREALLTVVAAMGQIVDLSGSNDVDAEDNSNEKSTVGEIILMVIRIIAMIYILIFITIFPVIVAITALVKLIKVLTHLKNPEEVSGKVSGTMISYLIVAVVFALALTLFRGMEFGSGLTAILVFALVSVVLNVVASRLRSYESTDLKYVNVTQGSALLAAAGALVFLINLLNVNVLLGFFDSFGAYLEDVANDTSAINSSINLYNLGVDYGERVKAFTPGASYLIDLLVLVVFAILSLSVACSIVSTCAARLGLTKTKKNQKSGFISLGVMSIICSILPFVLSSLKNAKSYSLDKISSGTAIINEEVKGSIFTLSSDSKGALIGMLIGGILILCAGIASNILKKKFCSGISEEREAMILSGKAPAFDAAEPEEKVATEPEEKVATEPEEKVAAETEEKVAAAAATATESSENNEEV